MRMRYAVLALTTLMGMSGAFAQCLITGSQSVAPLDDLQYNERAQSRD